MSWFKKIATYAAGPMVYANKYVWDQLHKKQPSIPPQKFGTSAYGRPLPIVFGTTRITGNVLYMSPDDGSKTTEFLIGLCEGPITSVGRTWKGEQSSVNLWADFGLVAVLGSTPQAPVLTAIINNWPEQNLGYNGIAYVGGQNDSESWGSNLVSGYSFEVAGFFSGTGGAYGDAHPADIFNFLISDARCGIGRPALSSPHVGQDGLADSSYRRYATADSLFISPALIDQRDLSEHLSDILDATNADLLWKEGKFYPVPMCDVPVTGNGVTYSPAVRVQYHLGPDDFLVDGSEDPISVEMEPLDSTYNVAPVEFLERAAATPEAAYNTSVVESPEFTDIARNGIRKAEPAVMHMICRRDVATKISRLMAQRMCWSRTTFRFRVGWRHCRLEPCDLVSLTEPNLGLSQRVVRIERITESEDLSLEIEAVEWVWGTADVSRVHDTQSSESTFHVLDPIPWEPATRDLGNVPAGSVTEPHLGDGVVSGRTLQADTLRTTNYTAGGTEGTDSEYAISGAKMRRNDGLAQNAPALLVDPAGLKIGSKLISDAWISNTSLRSATGVGYYGGTWNITAGLGAPNGLDVLELGDWDSTNKRIRLYAINAADQGFDRMQLMGATMASSPATGGYYWVRPVGIGTASTGNLYIDLELWASSWNGSSNVSARQDWVAVNAGSFDLTVLLFSSTGGLSVWTSN